MLALWTFQELNEVPNLLQSTVCFPMPKPCGHPFVAAVLSWQANGNSQLYELRSSFRTRTYFRWPLSAFPYTKFHMHQFVLSPTVKCKWQRVRRSILGSQNDTMRATLDKSFSLFSDQFQFHCTILGGFSFPLCPSLLKGHLMTIFNLDCVASSRLHDFPSTNKVQSLSSFALEGRFPLVELHEFPHPMARALRLKLVQILKNNATTFLQISSFQRWHLDHWLNRSANVFLQLYMSSIIKSEQERNIAQQWTFNRT